MTYEFDISAATTLSPLIRFGTCSWTYPGWNDLIYRAKYSSEKHFNQESLKEYASIPLFRTVCIDSTFYAPPKAETLMLYISQVPQTFSFVSKVWERITIPVYPDLKRYGKFAGKVNDDFLNPSLFDEQVLSPYRDSKIKPFIGPFVFQFPELPHYLVHDGSFLERLDTLLASLDPQFQYATEIRNPTLLHSDYFSILNARGVTHCFNHWGDMPSLKIQMKKAALAGGIAAPFFVGRLLTPLGMGYTESVKRFEPYATIKHRLPEMRQDVMRLMERSELREIPAYILINNRLEGNSPMTINEIIGEYQKCHDS